MGILNCFPFIPGFGKAKNEKLVSTTPKSMHKQFERGIGNGVHAQSVESIDIASQFEGVATHAEEPTRYFGDESHDKGNGNVLKTDKFVAETNKCLPQELVQNVSSGQDIGKPGNGPAITNFAYLRTLNLSGKNIVHITPEILPTTLHVLILSRNKISMIEGLQNLTRLRVLDLSYNRLTRIGYGLRKCRAIRELYLGGNKVSDVTGLHRLWRLTVLDLSCNRITSNTTLQHLAANHKSLLALNLLGNPIAGDKQLKMLVSRLLPCLVYLNNQPMQKVYSKAALGFSTYTKNRSRK